MNEIYILFKLENNLTKLLAYPARIHPIYYHNNNKLLSLTYNRFTTFQTCGVPKEKK